MDLSIITAHYNDADRLTLLRDSLLKQSWSADQFEWIVVDDGSSEPLPDWLTGEPDMPFRTSLIRLEQNQGRAKARNHGIRAAKGEIVGFLDADVIASPFWVESMVRGVQATGGVLVGKLIPHPELPLTAYSRYFHTRGAAKHSAGQRIPGKYFATSTSAIPHHYLQEIEGFDEAFNAWGGEDLDLGVRLEKAGATLYYEPRARVLHYHEIDWTTIEQRYRIYSRETVPYLLEKHPEAREWLTLHLLEPGTGGMKGRLTRLLLGKPQYLLLALLNRIAPRFPWPDILFDYMVFYLYSRDTSAALKQRQNATGTEGR